MVVVFSENGTFKELFISQNAFDLIVGAARKSAPLVNGYDSGLTNSGCLTFDFASSENDGIYSGWVNPLDDSAFEFWEIVEQVMRQQ